MMTQLWLDLSARPFYVFAEFAGMTRLVDLPYHVILLF